MNAFLGVYVRATRWLLLRGGVFVAVGCSLLGWWGKALFGAVAAAAGLGLCALVRRLPARERGER